MDSLSEADKMFEKLGYEKIEDKSCEARYKKDFKLKGARHIIFGYFKGVSVCEENERQIAVNRDYFDMQELKAINKKVEELGWN